jgi:allantoate deiminase
MADTCIARAEEIIARCQAIAGFSEAAHGTTRTFLCEAMQDCHRMLSAWMESLGLEVRVDAIGNLRGLYRGADSGAKRLIIGSHLDTVPNAGAYDGVLGVVLAIALVEALGKHSLPFDIEVIGFSEEEGVRFRVPFIGSRALIGTIDRELLNRCDARNVTLEQAIRNFGLDPSRIDEAALDPQAFAYLEFHIEQGPVLDSLDKPLAVVEAIAGQTRVILVFTGQANHAGTTPMHLRHDALAGAAEWMGIVETEAKDVPGLVATVGSLEVQPGAANVIPGEVRLSLDVRHASDEVRTRAVDGLLQKAQEVARTRGLSSNWKLVSEQCAVKMDPALIQLAERALHAAGSPAERMVSGAGHDAMILARKVPSVMIFLRSPGGISHHPQETVRVEDVELALHAGVHFIEQLASSTN